jgi:hypothetical protein
MQGENPSYGGAMLTLDNVPAGQSPNVLLDDTGVIRGSVVKPNQTPANAPVVRKFVVLKTGSIQQQGLRVSLPEGKIIDSNNYDIKDLVRTGIKLRELKEGDEERY